MRQIAFSSSSFNYTNVQDPQVDKALDAALQELDPNKRGDMYNALQQNLLKAPDYVPIYHNVTIVVAKKNVKNFIVNPLELFDLRNTSLA